MHVCAHIEQTNVQSYAFHNLTQLFSRYMLPLYAVTMGAEVDWPQLCSIIYHMYMGVGCC